MSWRKRIYTLVDEDSKLGNIFGTLVILLIVLNMLAIILESIKALQANYHFVFEGFENFCLVVFTIEYLVRVLTADIKYPGLKGPKPFFKYIFSFMAIVDLLAILPSLLLIVLPQGMLADLQFIRMLRIMRVFRVLKITRYSSSLKMMGEVLKDKRSDLSITIFVTFVLMIISSTLMYYAEHTTQPDQFPDIVHAFWWAVATLTTVGYGDVYPVTALGKILSGIIAILGIGLVALPTGILSSAFVDRMEAQKRLKRGEIDEEGNELYPNGGGPKDQPASNGNGQAIRTVVVKENGEQIESIKELFPECPHDALIATGDFPMWMQYCPLCGKSMEKKPQEEPDPK